MYKMWKTFNDFVAHPEIKGYKLLQTYPGCNKEVVEFEPYTNGEFSKFPHIWEPVYHKHIERDKKIDEILDGDRREI